MGEVSTIGLDIGKSVFQIHGVDADGTVVIRKRISRAKLLEFFASLPACRVGIEACPSGHYWSRRLQALGHTVRLLPPSYVKAYLKRSKNDANDAAAICEAVTRPSMRFVPTKSEEQQSGLMLHRSRQLLVCQRTMLSNAIRGHMASSALSRRRTAMAQQSCSRSSLTSRMAAFQRLRGSASPSLLANMRLPGLRSWPLRSVSTLGTARVKKADGWRRSLALVRLSLPRWWPRSEIGKRSRPAAVLLHGSDWCRDSIRPVAKTDWAASRSRAIDICAGCSSPVPWL